MSVTVLRGHKPACEWMVSEMHRFQYGIFNINDDWTVTVWVDNYFLRMQYAFRESLESMIKPHMENARQQLVRMIARGEDDFEPKKIVFTPAWQTRRTVSYVNDFYPWLRKNGE